MTRGGARPGAGRPRVYPDKTRSITLSLEARVADALNEYAQAHDLSRSAAASRLIGRAVELEDENADMRAMLDLIESEPAP